MIRIFAIFAVLPFFGVFATQHEWVVRKIVHSDDGSLIGCNIGCVICGAGLNYPIANVQNGWCTCHSPQRAVRVVSQHLCYTDPENNADELPFAEGSILVLRICLRLNWRLLIGILRQITFRRMFRCCSITQTGK